MSKPELITLSRSKIRNGFRYKTVKYILGKGVAEELITYTNTCPIFWAFVFCMFAMPFYGTAKFVIMGLSKGLEKLLDYYESSLTKRFNKSFTKKKITETDLYDAWKVIQYHEQACKRLGAKISKYNIKGVNNTGIKNVDDYYAKLIMTKYGYPKDDTTGFKNTYSALHDRFDVMYDNECRIARDEAKKRAKYMADVKEYLKETGSHLKPKVKKKVKSDDEITLNKKLNRAIINKAIKFGKIFWGLIITTFLSALCIGIGYLVEISLLELINVWSWSGIGSGMLFGLKWIGIILGIIGGIAAIAYLVYKIAIFLEGKIKASRETKFLIIKILVSIGKPFAFLGVWFWRIVSSIFVGIFYTFIYRWLIGKTVEAFSGYFAKDYKGYCPGIKWVD